MKVGTICILDRFGTFTWCNILPRQVRNRGLLVSPGVAASVQAQPCCGLGASMPPHGLGTAHHGRGSSLPPFRPSFLAGLGSTSSCSLQRRSGCRIWDGGRRAVPVARTQGGCPATKWRCPAITSKSRVRFGWTHIDCSCRGLYAHYVPTSARGWLKVSSLQKGCQSYWHSPNEIVLGDILNWSCTKHELNWNILKWTEMN